MSIAQRLIDAADKAAACAIDNGTLHREACKAFAKLAQEVEVDFIEMNTIAAKSIREHTDRESLWRELVECYEANDDRDIAVLRKQLGLDNTGNYCKEPDCDGGH